jgi:predicted RNase H-like nuclease (RuvC/YqgF family)
LKTDEALRHQVEVFRRRAKRFWKQVLELKRENAELKKMIKEDRQHELALKCEARRASQRQPYPLETTPPCALRESPGVL